MAGQQKGARGRAIAPGQSVFHGGQFYVAGQEDELHAAMRGSKTAAEDIARLSREGVISGFGAKGIDEASLASDPTIQAGEEDAVMEDDGEAGGAGESETVHRDGLYSEEARKSGGASRKGKR